MLATLHSPIRSADEILQIAREQREETPHLEFKAFWGIWCKQEKGEGKAGSAPETAKDVAAFANSEGGDILVGISTSPATGRASGFIPQLPEVREPEDELRKVLSPNFQR